MVRRRLIPLLLCLVLLGAVALLLASGGAAKPPPKRGPVAASTSGGAVTAFGVDLMRVVGGPGNLAFSPYSVAQVLAMAGVGAGGSTATQIARVLHVASPAKIAGIGTLSSTLAGEQSAAAHGASTAPQLDLANGLFLQQGFAVAPAFTNTLTSGFGAPPQSVDFSGDPSAASAAVNQFVSQHTMGVIPSILSPGMITTSTRLALVNAVYLKASWLDPFAVSATASGPFHAPAGTRQVPFMSETNSLPYAKGSGYRAVELPYQSSTFALLVLDPTGNESAFEKTVTPALLAHVTASLRATVVALKLPRFHISLQAALASPLEHLGMPAAFNAQTANFSGISSTPTFLAFVQHDADFTVDEAGTIATAATVGGISATAVEVPPRPAVTIDLNRPFPFYLIDTKTGTVIFAGRLTDPSTAQPAGG
jgi:serpin B